MLLKRHSRQKYSMSWKLRESVLFTANRSVCISYCSRPPRPVVLPCADPNAPVLDSIGFFIISASKIVHGGFFVHQIQNQKKNSQRRINLHLSRAETQMYHRRVCEAAHGEAARPDKDGQDGTPTRQFAKNPTVSLICCFDKSTISQAICVNAARGVRSRQAQERPLENGSPRKQLVLVPSRDRRRLF